MLLSRMCFNFWHYFECFLSRMCFILALFRTFLSRTCLIFWHCFERAHFEKGFTQLILQLTKMTLIELHQGHLEETLWEMFIDSFDWDPEDQGNSMNVITIY